MMRFGYMIWGVIDDFFHDDIPNKTVYILINYNLISY
ncbi:hypothetical protein XBKB1_1270040 [Xenorhabdus bovienii str. kraussei Becker Underwood]|uniref:Uncharacterized protein n=1 Tax=Xenorhabdus bovienii str. kraussei Becker Underwood TaxID=1398204 RepID=A0A077PEE4_XENBV|nr:hypothetical protein XBKB1_1270040 [Xenorhabdus bovienii str. kraussei Becker Underwood]